MSKKTNASTESFNNIYFDDVAQEEIFNLFRQISEQTGASYMSYLYENFDKNLRYAFTTNPDWGKAYVENNRIDKCHMWLNVTQAFLSTNTKRYILLWDTIKPETEKQKSIYFDRTDHEIGVNGVSFCSKFDNSREILGLAPDLNTPKFQEYLSRNMDVVRNAICKLREKLTVKLILEHENNEIITKE